MVQAEPRLDDVDAKIHPASADHSTARAGARTDTLTWFSPPVETVARGVAAEQSPATWSHSPKSRPLLDAVMSDKEVLHPDELFFQTLAFNSHLGAPGACLNIPLPTEVNEGYPGRYVLWGDRHTFCPTKYVRGVCILGSPHVPKMRHSHHLFANKMHADYYPEAYDCMEQWYFQRLNREWQLGGIDQEAFESGEYMGLTCSKYHVH
nr:unnamed protein product [Spirometra erinaceieuropaei]